MTGAAGAGARPEYAGGGGDRLSGTAGNGCGGNLLGEGGVSSGKIILVFYSRQRSDNGVEGKAT